MPIDLHKEAFQLLYKLNNSDNPTPAFEVAESALRSVAAQAASEKDAEVAALRAALESILVYVGLTSIRHFPIDHIEKIILEALGKAVPDATD